MKILKGIQTGRIILIFRKSIYNNIDSLVGIEIGPPNNSSYSQPRLSSNWIESGFEVIYENTKE